MINEIGWDYLMCTENNNITILKELMQKALVANLNPQETKVLIDIFESDANNLINNQSENNNNSNKIFQPNQLPDLVEKNPIIASNLLIKLSPCI